MTTINFGDWLGQFAHDFNANLDQVLSHDLRGDSRLQQSMKYAMQGGGKRIRPALCSLVAGTAADPDVVARVCVAIEAVHTYSLVHDDLPAMDDDSLRRGRATTHVAYDEATAILCGDALLTYAFEVLSTLSLPAAQSLQLVQILSTAAGPKGMVLGQQLDIDATSTQLDWQQVQEIHNLKTGALISSAIQMGAVLAGRDVNIYTDFSKQIGLLFQVVDDVLDAISDSKSLGKTAGKDQAASKSTAVSALGLKSAQDLAKQLCDSSINSLRQIGVSGDSHLNELPKFLLGRSF
ncbi:MAG: polyprenyl synthetase family protein [Planctomycetes bacterium]|nr:polyprenyl synthetase family protein [Planctomycetota bacterium]